MNLPVVHEKLPLRSLSSAPTPRFSAPPVVDEPNESNRPLTRRQKLAIERYVSGEARTQAEAARQAGYAETTAAAAANEIFAKPNVRLELQRRNRKLFENFEITSQDIINDLYVMSESNILDFIEIQPEDGSFKFTLKNLTREKAKAIRELGWDAIGRTKLILHDARACKMDIARLKGIGTEDKNTLHSNLDGPFTIEKLDQLIAQSTTNNSITINQQINVADPQRFLPPRPLLEPRK